TRLQGDWSSDVCSSDLDGEVQNDIKKHNFNAEPPLEAPGLLASLILSLVVGGLRYGVTKSGWRTLVKRPPAPRSAGSPSSGALRSEERRVGKEGRSPRW